MVSRIRTYDSSMTKHRWQPRPRFGMVSFFAHWKEAFELERLPFQGPCCSFWKA